MIFKSSNNNIIIMISDGTRQLLTFEGKRNLQYEVLL